jgi:hypothetical protein
MSYKNTARAVQVDEQQEQSLRCSAHGCPLKWSVKIESGLCSYHAWEDPVKWHAITDELRRTGTWHRASAESREVQEMKTRLRGSIGNVPQRIAA